MGHFIDLTGTISGKLKALERVENDKTGNSRWLCLCECGNKKIVLGTSLKRSRTKSCGCTVNEIKFAGKHGCSTEITPEYRAWANMKRRCVNPNDKGFKNYGGRGITVCTRWMLSFNDFLKDMGIKPSNKHSIERIDVNGNYEPNNCKWATNTEQVRNRRKNKNNTSGNTGIYWNKEKKTYVLKIYVNYKPIYIGSSKSLDEAKLMRIEAELKYWGKSS